MEIKANKDNDLKYKQGLQNQPTKPVMKPIDEAGNKPDEEVLEYFTE